MMGLFRRRPLPQVDWAPIYASSPLLATIAPETRPRLERLAAEFLRDKRFLGGGGFEPEAHVCETIAALAAVPILGLGSDWYRGWRSLIVYADTYRVPQRREDEAGVVHEWTEEQAGSAWADGGVILSWGDVIASLEACDGYNVVIHELAHKLDMLDPQTLGRPPLHRDMDGAAWARAFSAAYDALCAEVDADREPWLDPYAATAPDEFFAVVSEAFFELPEELAAHYPALYRELLAFYRVDPARGCLPL